MHTTMATLADIGVSAFINIVTAFAFLLAFALLRIQPNNDRVYFPKWYINGERSSPRHIKTYLTSLNWMPEAWRKSEDDIIKDAGLDSAVFLRIYTLGFKIFAPMTVLALLILIPVNISGGTLSFLIKELVTSDIDKLSISNVRPASKRFFFHIGLQYLFTMWTCYMLYKEYDYVASKRFDFLASQSRRVEQFTVVVRNVPCDPDTIDRFFQTNHPNDYLCLQKIVKDPKANPPVAFVSFKSRWGAAVCAQTQQKKNSTLWFTNWAPEPRDVYWRNLAIPFVFLSIRKLVISLTMFALVFFSMIPIAFVQSLANLEGLERVAPFLRPVIEP